MADVKISGLPASTVPLAGTEVLPIVQGGTTKQVSIANVTAGRSVAALSVITPTIQAEAGSAGGTIKNGSGVAQMQWGSGGASNLSLEVATNINPANAAVSIAPTGTGTVTINPATASNMNNVAIGGTTPLAGKFTALEATGVTTVQAGSVSAPAITTTGDTNTGIFFPAADTIAFAEGGVESMRIDSSSRLLVGLTSANASGSNFQVSQGVTFPATQSASTDPNTLDDYEEGTWTPNQGSGLTVVGAFTSVGYYTKIGSFVTVNGYVKGATSVAIPAASSLICTNLPFGSVAGIFWTGSMLNWNADSSGVCAAQQATNNLFAGNVIAASDRISFEFSYRV